MNAEPSPTPPPAALGRARSDRARQVADVLRGQVLAGDLTGVLPPERMLIAEFGVTRNTIREALDLLRADGLVTRRPGIGTVVCGVKYPHGLHRLAGLAEVLREHGTVTNEVRAAGPITAPAQVAAQLRLDRGAEVTYVERLRRLGGEPLSLDLTYLPADVGAPLLERDLAGNDIFALLEEIHGQRLGVAEVGMEAVNADPDSATVLEVPRGAALLRWERLTHFASGRPIDLEYIRFRGDRLTLRARLDRLPA